jgi:acetyl esterase
VEPLPDFDEILDQARRSAHPAGAIPCADLRLAVDSALQRWAGAGPAVSRVHDAVVECAARPIPVRIFEPASAAGRPPVIVLCHGSGFVLGSIDTHDALARHLAICARAVVVSVDYALAPEHPFPAAVDECLAVLDWVQSGGLRDRADATRVALAGDSAGGAIAVGVCLRARDSGQPLPVAQLLLYPVCDVSTSTPSWERYGQGYFLDRETMNWFWDRYLATPQDRTSGYAVPLAAADLGGMPATIVMTAGCDPLQDEGREYARRLQHSKVPTVSLSYDFAIHGFLTMYQVSPAALAGTQIAASALGHYLHSGAGARI